MPARTSFSYKLSPAQQSVLSNILTQGNYRPVHVEHATISAETEKCRITIYKSGKCLIQGRNAQDFVSFVMEPQVLQQAQVGYEDILDPEGSQPHIGVDESGKGDFFGPLVVAAAYVDEDLIKKMRDMDVKDSKNISSDGKALSLGRDLRMLLGNRFSIVKIGPASYNRLYSRMRNVNTMLGWAHARAIENILEVLPQCRRAISDQFGNKAQIERALMQKGRQIELIQRPKAESDLAVAAASIIAREIFLRSLKDLQSKHEVKLPKGASAAVRKAGVELAKKSGPEVLVETAKCHFKTTDAVLGEMNLTRKVLGPDGQAVSKPTAFRGRTKKSA